MAHDFEEPAGQDLTLVDVGFTAETIIIRGEPHITLTGTTGRRVTICEGDAPNLAALILAHWRAMGDDEDDDDDGE